MKRIFDNLKLLVKSNPEKFFMNRSEYKGMKVAMFDYSLTIPSDFNGDDAFECRGSLFQVDEDNNYVKTLALPFEKFFNIHEYDFGNNEGLYYTVKQTYGVDVRSSSELLALPIKNVLVKEDGSIIAAFEFQGELCTKSNSSLTSDYAKWGYDIINNDKHLLDKTTELVNQDKVVLYELRLRDNPIVLEYDRDSIIVLAVRDRTTGEYMSYNDVVAHFGKEYVVEEKTHTANEIVELLETLTDTEGFVVTTECGLRYKAKTNWYVERHHRLSHFFASPRHVWEAFVNGDLDDCYALFSGNEINKARIDNLVEKCDNLYTQMLHDGVELYEQFKHCTRPDFFKHIKEYVVVNDNRKDKMISGYIAEQLYKSGGDREVTAEKIKTILLKKANISELGIARWNYE